jgi:carboxymethylenebutenolidase
MAETVEFECNGGGTASGHLVVPEVGSGPGVVVLQEWWGIDPGIKDVAQWLGDAGFVALVPDLYHGELAAHTEMDKAAELMSALPPDRAARDMSAAVDCLAAHPAVRGDGLGVVGFCMGGMLAWLLAADRGDRIALEAKLQQMGKDVVVTVHPGTGHAFMNPYNPLGTQDEALGARIWPEACAFLHERLD